MSGRPDFSDRPTGCFVNGRPLEFIAFDAAGWKKRAKQKAPPSRMAARAALGSFSNGALSSTRAEELYHEVATCKNRKIGEPPSPLDITYHGCPEWR